MKKVFFSISLIILTGLSIYYFWPSKSLDNTKRIDKIVVKKNERKLIVYSAEQKLKTYRISLGKIPVGKKEFEGDMKTPEGHYIINDKNPKSAYYLNLGISYPNEQDIQHAKTLGKNPGGQIKIHGLKNGFGFIGKFHRLFDWTLGCIAVTNSEIKELYDYVPLGTEVIIKE